MFLSTGWAVAIATHPGEARAGLVRMSVLAGLFAQAEAGGGGGGAGVAPPKRVSDGTWRFEVRLDPSETQVICFDELVEVCSCPLMVMMRHHAIHSLAQRV